jgi:hypothetical protein
MDLAIVGEQFMPIARVIKRLLIESGSAPPSATLVCVAAPQASAQQTIESAGPDDAARRPHPRAVCAVAHTQVAGDAKLRRRLCV